MSNTKADLYIDGLSVGQEIMYEDTSYELLFKDCQGCLLMDSNNNRVCADWAEVEEDYERMQEEAKEDGLKEWGKQYLVNNR